jgi:salicylate hydroxylase
MTDVDVAIAGGGVAGLALALLLAHRGIRSRVYERETHFSPAGNGIQLGPNISGILESDPLLKAHVEKNACIPDSLIFMDGSSGRQLNAMPLGDAARQRWGGWSRVIHRADFHHALRQAISARPEITLLTGHSLHTFTEGSHSVGISGTHADGSAFSHQCAYLVGADGVWSKIRLGLADPPPRPTSQTAWRALIPAAGFPVPWGSSNTGLWLAHGLHLVHYPVRSGAWINAVITTPSSVKELKTTTRHVNLSRTLQEIIQGAPEWTPWPLHENSLSLGKGRVLLMGDAAHAMLPHLAQGAGQALEDAAALGQLIPLHAGSIETLLSSYRHSRAKRLQRIMAASRRNGKIYQLGGVRAQARNVALRTIPPSLLMRKMDWLYKMQG